MATSQAIIDLSAIPVPDAVEVPDTAVLVTQIVAKYQELDTLFSALVESDPAYKWAEALAFRVALMRQQVNDAVRGVLLASARRNDLDQIGANFQVQRLVITPADDSTIPPTPAVYEDDDAFPRTYPVCHGHDSAPQARKMPITILHRVPILMCWM